MKSPQSKPTPPPLPRSWRRAVQRLDHALEQNAPLDFSEKIDLLGRQLFGDLWNHKPSLPEASPSPSGRGRGEGESNQSNAPGPVQPNS